MAYNRSSMKLSESTTFLAGQSDSVLQLCGRSPVPPPSFLCVGAAGEVAHDDPHGSDLGDIGHAIIDGILQADLGGHHLQLAGQAERGSKDALVQIDSCLLLVLVHDGLWVVSLTLQCGAEDCGGRLDEGGQHVGWADEAAGSSNQCLFVGAVGGWEQAALQLDNAVRADQILIICNGRELDRHGLVGIVRVAHVRRDVVVIAVGVGGIGRSKDGRHCVEVGWTGGRFRLGEVDTSVWPRRSRRRSDRFDRTMVAS